MKALLAFLESDEPALHHVEFVISPFLQKTFTSLGRFASRKDSGLAWNPGYPLTLRQSDPDAINSSTLLHRALFERLRDYTLMKYPPVRSHSNSHENLRLATIRCLQESLAFCEDELRKTSGETAGH